MSENLPLVEGFTNKTEEQINQGVGNDSIKQGRVAELNEEVNSVIEEKSDYEIYNPAQIEDISFSISTKDLVVGGAYPITVTVNKGQGANPMANVPLGYIVYTSSDTSKAYVSDNVLYAIGPTVEEEKENDEAQQKPEQNPSGGESSGSGGSKGGAKAGGEEEGGGSNISKDGTGDGNDSGGQSAVLSPSKDEDDLTGEGDGTITITGTYTYKDENGNYISISSSITDIIIYPCGAR